MRVNERALLTVVAVLGCYPERPYDNSYSEDEKEEISFSQWALNELLDLLWDHPWTAASDVIEEFACKCQIYVATSVLPDQKRIFDIAEKTAMQLLKDIKEAER